MEVKVFLIKKEGTSVVNIIYIKVNVVISRIHNDHNQEYIIYLY